MGQLLVLTLNEQEEKIIDKIIEDLSDYISLEAFLASNPNRVFTQSQIFETVWNMESNSCHSSSARCLRSFLSTKNICFTKENSADMLRRLKAEPGKDIWICGGGFSNSIKMIAGKISIDSPSQS